MFCKMNVHMFGTITSNFSILCFLLKSQKIFEVYYILLLGYEFRVFFHLKFGIMQEMFQKHVWCLSTAYNNSNSNVFCTQAIVPLKTM